jgi:hypothetical protein
MLLRSVPPLSAGFAARFGEGTPRAAVARSRAEGGFATEHGEHVGEHGVGRGSISAFFSHGPITPMDRLNQHC